VKLGGGSGQADGQRHPSKGLLARPEVHHFVHKAEDQLDSSTAGGLGGLGVHGGVRGPGRAEHEWPGGFHVAVNPHLVRQAIGLHDRVGLPSQHIAGEAVGLPGHLLHLEITSPLSSASSCQPWPQPRGRSSTA
jgi:hypothetical protein